MVTDGGGGVEVEGGRCGRNQLRNVVVGEAEACCVGAIVGCWMEVGG